MSLPPLPCALAPVRTVVFMGSPAFAVPSLLAIHAAGFTISAVYTQPPRPAGRGLKLTKTPVHLEAEKLGLTVKHPEKLRNEALTEVLAEEADAYVVVAYGLLLPSALVRHKPCLNVHPSALPQYRGAAPLQHTLLNGETHTDVCIMQLDEGMDTGPVFARVPLAVGPDETYGTLHDATAALGAEALVNVLRTLHERTPEPQTGEPSHAGKITAEMRVLDLSRPAADLHNQIRALSPAPGATLSHPGILNGQTLKVGGSVLAGAPASSQPTLDDGILWLPAGGGTCLGVRSLQKPGGTLQPVGNWVF